MSHQSSHLSGIAPSLTTFGLATDVCPACGQEIPPDKLEEISGKIAAREREQTRVITAQLEENHAAERIRLESKAKEDIEAERQLSAARESKLRKEVEDAAARKIRDKEAELGQTQAELDQKLTNAETAKQAAESAVTTLKAELEKQRQASEADIAKAKESAAKDATERAELRHKDTVTAQEKAIKEANARAQEAEQALGNQREVMEQAKDEAVNAEKAKSFEETQKLLNTVSDLKRKLEKKTNEELGEGAEINIFEALRKEFDKDGDRIERIPKGTSGADIRHFVRFRGQECGTILYDSKNHKQWREEHAAKLKRDQLADGAEHAILSTHKFPQDTHQLHIRDGVVLANPARVVAVATIIRQHLIQLNTLRASKIERESKTEKLYEFIVSPQCRQLLDRIDERTTGLFDLQEKEMKWHQKHWKDEGAAIRAIQKAKGDLESEIDSIIGAPEDLAGASEED